ncbi:MAG: hypothetical protein AABZ53_00405 [Planctomycetota bacterium]
MTPMTPLSRAALSAVVLAAAALTGALLSSLLAAGPLNPPAGAVTSTYKTLTEVEPRIAINAANTPGDADSLFKITQPGSYYLTGNITGVPAKNGIEIASTGVSIDLGGFELLGVAGSLRGITNSVLIERTTIRNGTVRAWGSDGVGLSGNSYAGSIEGVDSTGNAGDGIAAGNAWSVTRCSSFNNAGSGFRTPTATTFSDCQARDNTGAGFKMNIGCAVTNCTAVENGSSGFQCDFDSNSFFHCNAVQNLVGFSLGDKALVSECVASQNDTDGIRASDDCLIRGNNCTQNGIGAAGGAGIQVSGSDNRIESNNCTDADRGIDIDGVGNIIIKNTCSGNATNWTIAASNAYGPIVATPPGAAVNGNTGVAALGSTDPNANFSY